LIIVGSAAEAITENKTAAIPESNIGLFIETA